MPVTEMTSGPSSSEVQGFSLSAQFAQPQHDTGEVTGYLHPLYAASLMEFGKPRELAGCGGWILEREISGCAYRDAMGCYPLFSCRNWSQLGEDVAQLENELVSFSLVTDPFGDFNVDELKSSFGVCFHYKDHYVTDLSEPMERVVSRHHKKEVRRALRQVMVETVLSPETYAQEWAQLYAELVRRYSIGDIRKFSRQAFEAQLRVPGIVYFRVLGRGKAVGGNLFYVQGDVAYGHLSAFTLEGYKLGAAYAVKWAALEYFTGKVAWMTIGGGAGVKGSEDDGLARFKRGWATDTRPVYFCGRILEQGRYAELAKLSGTSDCDYFPVYRAGEFA